MLKHIFFSFVVDGEKKSLIISSNGIFSECLKGLVKIIKAMNISIRLSKFMSFVLRHKPENFGLKPDPFGFVNTRDLLLVLQNRYGNVQLPDIERVVKNCPKGRFEIKGEKIRARYAHSIEVQLDTQPSEPLEYLYHGTSPAMKNTVLAEGLKSMQRKYVHLSKNKEEAFQVGRRKSQSPIVFTIKAKEAFQNGIKFYDMGIVVLTEFVPSEFIELVNG
jgi:putative RNA 2'-phosphotransferase